MPPDLNEEAILRGLSTCVMGSRVIHLPVTTSTMDVIHREAHAGAPEGTLALADEQTAGRGRFQPELGLHSRLQSPHDPSPSAQGARAAPYEHGR